MIAKEGRTRSRRGLASYAIGVILIHFTVTLMHGFAHSRLGIALNTAQELFVGVVIAAAPLVAGYLLWKGKLRSGGALLAASMAGALVFGVFYHFIAPGPDNVNHQFLPGLMDWTRIFDQTAVGIAALEVLGSILGLIIVLKPNEGVLKPSERASKL